MSALTPVRFLLIDNRMPLDNRFLIFTLVTVTLGVVFIAILSLRTAKCNVFQTRGSKLAGANGGAPMDLPSYSMDCTWIQSHGIIETKLTHYR